MERIAKFHIIKTGKQGTGFTFQFTLGQRKSSFEKNVRVQSLLKVN